MYDYNDFSPKNERIVNVKLFDGEIINNLIYDNGYFYTDYEKNEIFDNTDYVELWEYPSINLKLFEVYESIEGNRYLIIYKYNEKCQFPIIAMNLNTTEKQMCSDRISSYTNNGRQSNNFKSTCDLIKISEDQTTNVSKEIIKLRGDNI